MPTAVKAVMR